MRRRFVLSIGFLIAVLFASYSNVEACSCWQMTSCEAFARSEFVFTGKIIKALDEQGTRKHQVQVEETFRGIENTMLVDIFTDNSSSCMFAMTEGVDYLIFAWRSEKDGKLWTGFCSHTAPLEYAKEDLEYLRSVKASGKSGGTIQGEVLEAERSNDQPKKPEQIDQVFIESSDGQKYEATIEPDGKYQVSGLSAGKYQIFVKPPKGYITNYDASPYAGDETMIPKFVEVNGHGCTVKNFSIKTNGVISGKVIDANGLPVGEKQVNLKRLADPNKINRKDEITEQSAEPEDSEESETVKPLRVSAEKEAAAEEFEEDYNVYTDENGFYSFKGLPPGRYLLGFGIDDFLDIELNEDQYLPTYFPSSQKKEEAVVIELKKAEVLTDKNIQLFPKLKKRIIKGQVVFKNGRPVSKIESEIYARRDGISNTDWLGDLKIDAKGNFTVEAFEETEYLISVRYYTGKKQDGLIEEGFSNKCFIIPKSGNLKPVKIILEKGTANCDDTKFRGN